MKIFDYVIFFLLLIIFYDIFQEKRYGKKSPIC